MDAGAPSIVCPPSLNYGRAASKKVSAIDLCRMPELPEVEYIARVRSGVKGHFSYREIAWEMRERLAEIEAELARLIQATPPWVEDLMTR